MQLNTVLVSVLCAIAPVVSAIDCERVSGGPGPAAVKAVKDFFLRDYVKGSVCAPGQDRKFCCFPCRQVIIPYTSPN